MKHLYKFSFLRQDLARPGVINNFLRMVLRAVLIFSVGKKFHRYWRILQGMQYTFHQHCYYLHQHSSLKLADEESLIYSHHYGVKLACIHIYPFFASFSLVCMKIGRWSDISQ